MQQGYPQNKGKPVPMVTSPAVSKLRESHFDGGRSAILCMATVGEVYRLPLRATEGLMRSVMKLLGVNLSVPRYTTLCRRRKHLEVGLPRLCKKKKGEPLHLVVDATGVKVYGEGEWKVRQHGYTKRRTWRKLHFAVDEATMEFIAVMVSTNSFKDSQVLPDLLEQTADAITQVSADGAYDSRNCYDALRERGARAAIPPRTGSRIWHHGNTRGERHIRDENLRAIRRKGRAGWKRECDYHQRSLASDAGL